MRCFPKAVLMFVQTTFPTPKQHAYRCAARKSLVVFYSRYDSKQEQAVCVAVRISIRTTCCGRSTNIILHQKSGTAVPGSVRGTAVLEVSFFEET